eukprot:gnl/MRDRNA2_/MRDRNA2_203136_c0_seq1.p1 gnl/MRDRNA2_/MRDRNA2_203136_c0~~gnl/MRDRNA2_/MRDRNA2_203136_c0_seq1.p1  ORF type:complete len:117 (+),score=17.47 gnl/MRDRNA2_/MRDRNA2_203136_c0_seq1:97-447(+)
MSFGRLVSKSAVPARPAASLCAPMPMPTVRSAFLPQHPGLASPLSSDVARRAAAFGLEISFMVGVCAAALSNFGLQPLSLGRQAQIRSSSSSRQELPVIDNQPVEIETGLFACKLF